MTAVVTMSNVALMGVTKEQMLADAQKNLNNKEHVFMSISAMMAEMMMGLQDMVPEEYGPPLYVLTNKEKTQGAAMIARPDIMKEIGDKFGCDYYVLPSSCHEVLVMPVSADVELEMLSAMVHEILKRISSTDENRFVLSTIELPPITRNRLRKNSKKKSSYASNKIEGNPLTEKQADEVIERDEHKHFLKPE